MFLFFLMLRAGPVTFAEKGGGSYHAKIFAYKSSDADHIFLCQRRKSGVKSPADSPASPRCEAGVTHNVRAPRSFRRRFLAWKIGPLSFLLPSSPLLPPDNMKAVEHGFSLATASVVWRCSGFSPTFSRNTSLISPARLCRTGVRVRGRCWRVSSPFCDPKTSLVDSQTP